MNTRERFLEVMHFNTSVRSLKWEYAYWGKTLNQWYEQGLTKIHYPKTPREITNTSASLYTAAWTHRWRHGEGQNIEDTQIPEPRLPDGLAVWGEATYWPTQGFPLERDVHEHFHLDHEVGLVAVEQLFCPRFEPAVIEEDEESMVYVDLDGVTRKLLRKESTIPTAMDWPTYSERDYPLALGGYPLGFFGLPAHLLGYKNLFYFYYDKPALIKDMASTFCDVWIALWEEVLSFVEVDVVHIFEDVSSGTGSMVSPSVIREFMLPYYKRITDFLKGKGIDIILVDTDGNCMEIIPLFIEGGATGMYPMEASTGIDVMEVRKKYPILQIMGGIPKRELAAGAKRIDEILEPVGELLSRGGYVPFCDHSVPPEVPWTCFKYYRENLNRIIDYSANR
jgi:uroporphyrinogen decarboxylase